jgi:hypothetical protein
MCVPKAPKPPAPPAQRQATREPANVLNLGNDNQRRIRGYAALVSRAQPSLQPPVTTSTLGG